MQKQDKSGAGGGGVNNTARGLSELTIYINKTAQNQTNSFAAKNKVRS